MLIKNKVRSLDHHLTRYAKGADVFVALLDIDRFQKKLFEVGFTDDLVVGESRIPDWGLGRHCFNNSEGEIVIRRDLDRETYYQYFEWHWEDYAGTQYSDFKYIPRKRYVRERKTPHNVEIQICKADDMLILKSGPLVYDDDSLNRSRLKNTINMYIELFGECTILDRDMVDLVTPIRRLPWTILPPGNNPWDSVDGVLTERLARYPKRKRAEIYKRHETIMLCNPDFIACGNDAFQGYVIFGFQDRGLYILESEQLNNATYVFGDDWQVLSKMTKSEIIRGNSHIARVIHSDQWRKRILELIGHEKSA